MHHKRTKSKELKMKAIDVARYFITLNDNECKDEKSDLSKLKIQKLLYYAQGYYLALYNKPLFDEKILAWQHGPVVKEVYYSLESLPEPNANFIPTDKYKMSASEIKKLGKKEKELIEDVFQLMGQYSAWRLRDKTHQEDPWRDNYKEGKKNIEISQNDMEKYFRNYVESE